MSRTHRQRLERLYQAELTRHSGELVVTELKATKKKVSRGAACEGAAHVQLLQRGQTTDFGRNRGQAVHVQLVKPSAWRGQKKKRRPHAEFEHVGHEQHAWGKDGEGIVVDLRERRDEGGGGGGKEVNGRPTWSRLSTARCFRIRRRVVDRQAARRGEMKEGGEKRRANQQNGSVSRDWQLGGAVVE